MVTDFDLACFSLQMVKYKVAVSNDSKKYYQRFRSQSFVCEEDLPVETGELSDLEVFSDADNNLEEKSAESMP